MDIVGRTAPVATIKRILLLVVQTPTNLNEEAKKALEAFDAACGNRPSEDSTSETSEKTEKKKKGFREKVKEMFEE